MDRSCKERGRELDVTEFNSILEENKPLRRLVSDSLAWKRKPPYPSEEQFCPRDKKVYRNFDSGHCYGCAYCFAIEEVDGDKQYVYCKYPDFMIGKADTKTFGAAVRCVRDAI